MNERAIAEDLVGLGLTQYEAKAYVALVRRDSFTAAQVARQAGVPRQRIYDVLSSLVEKGLASARPGDVVKYAAVAPELAIERLVELQRRRRLRARAMAARERSRELTPAYIAGQRETDPLEYIEVLRDRRAINERFAELQRGIEHEILVFTKPPYATPPQENVEGLEVAADARRAERLRAVRVRRPRLHRGRRGGSSRPARRRASSRSLPLKLVIIDETIVHVRDGGPGRRRADLTIWWSSIPSLAQILKIAFDAVWARG